MPTVKVGEISMYYELRGEGEPVVLIAGLGTNISPYRRIVDELSKGFKVLSFDNRGVGHTDKPDISYSMEMMADDTAGLMRVLGIASGDVIGVSMGGRIAMALTLRYPEMVKSLVLASTAPRVVRKGGMPAWFKLVKRLRTVGRVLGRSPQPYYAFVRQFDASGAYDCTARLGEIHASTLIVHGRKDRLAPYALAEEMHSGIADSKLVTFDGGHIFMFWHSKRFANVVIEFLSSLPR
ncbi:MAG: alpha/beta hydrolase [Thaumarchaeota archaeon]|nr:alpha/beta hydrolase [Nitrososphaerota archaeon]